MGGEAKPALGGVAGGFANVAAQARRGLGGLTRDGVARWVAMGPRKQKRAAVVAFALCLTLYLVLYIVGEIDAGEDGRSFVNALGQCVYRSYRDTSGFSLRDGEPYDDLLLSCDENHK